MKYVGVVFFVVLAGCATVSDRTARHSGVGFDEGQTLEDQYPGAVITTTYTN